MRYSVVSPLLHDARLYNPGDVVDLDDARGLIALGVVAPEQEAPFIWPPEGDAEGASIPPETGRRRPRIRGT